jgi:glycosyltransferase involved in cell wall biosynthesis
MPKYENLDLCLPPLIKMLRHLDKHQPNVIHVSTPGPVGVAGLIAARMLRVPVLGVYHTDFPAYIDRIFDDHALTWITGRAMRAFYSPFRSIFTRSTDYVESLVGLGMPRERILSLLPGVDTSVFHPRFADRSLWREHGMDPQVFKAIYVGRISVEKNMPLLTTVCQQTRERLARGTGFQPVSDRSRSADLVIVGDGPYRATMERELSGLGVHFLGFKHGEELSRLYASSDLFVFPSVTDTLGQVVMESQASGIPVLITDRGGPKEVVRNGETGLVLPPEPARPWADAIAGLVGDPDRRRRWGAAAFESMQSMSITASFEHFWKVHEEAWRAHLTDQGIASLKQDGASSQPLRSAPLPLVHHPAMAERAPASRRPAAAR